MEGERGERGERPGEGSRDEAGPGRPPAAGAPVVILVAARNEADRIGSTLDALEAAFPGAPRLVADDASSDGTADLAMRHGAEVISRGRPHGKGANVNAAAQAALPLLGSAGAGAEEPAGAGPSRAPGAREPVVLLCDGDLGACAGELTTLVEAVRSGDCDLAVADFSRRIGGGFGLALGFARWSIRRRCGLETSAPISGQRALSPAAFREVLPLAPGFGMEIGITIDAVRAGYRLREYEIDLEHRATGRTARGFAHRARQLRDFARVHLARRP